MELVTMQKVTYDAIVYITMYEIAIEETINIMVDTYDLNPGERRQLIQRLAKEGFKS